MSEQYLLLIHPTFGVLGIIAALWVFVDALNASVSNIDRMRLAAKVSTLMIWLSNLVAGYFYVNFYSADKELIIAGPWPWAHNFFMETKEHAFYLILLLATFLPIATSGAVATNRGARKVVLWSAAWIVLLGLAMEGAGAVIGMGAKVALMAKIG